MKAFWIALLAALIFSMGAPVQAETPLDMLKRVETEKPPPPVKMKTQQEICAELVRDASPKKCRGHYISMSYASQWRGVDRSSTHPLLLEVLTRGDDAVVCFGVVFLAIDNPADEWPCLALERSR